jgi:glycosyltransferase involved in cell wall biosynthesis
VRIYAHAHGYDISSALRDKNIRKKYLKLNNIDGIITMSEISRQRLIGIGLNPCKIHVIPYGVHVPEKQIEHRTRSTINCLAVGRMVSKKAPIYTLAAFHKAYKSNPLLRLDYIGDGELFCDVKEYVRHHELCDVVNLHGAQPNETVIKFMRDADIFLQHSRVDPDNGDEEGMPVAILEAMANSLPVISTRHAGIPEAVVENETGYLVDEGDIDGMAEHIINLSFNSNQRRYLGNAGWSRAKMNYSSNLELQMLKECLGVA